MEITNFHSMDTWKIREVTRLFGCTRTRRLLLCAFAQQFEPEIKSRPTMEAVKAAIKYSLEASPANYYAMSELRKNIENAIKATKEDPRNFHAGPKAKTREIAWFATALRDVTPTDVVYAFDNAYALQKTWKCSPVMNCICQERLVAKTRSPIVQAMAAAIYKEQDFAAMPVLADAIEEFLEPECQVMADHCRSVGQHWLGCYVLDSLR